MKKFLLSLAAVAMVSGSALADTVDLSFTNSNWDGWSGNSYSAHTLTADDYTVKLSAASKQSATINDVPVMKGGNITFTLNDQSQSLKNLTVNLRQWGTKAQKAKIEYSTDGTTFTQVEGADLVNWSITTGELPEGVIAVKATCTNTSNQVGYVSIDYELAGQTGPVLTNPNLSFSEENLTVSGLDAVFTAPTLSNEYNVAVTYGSSNEGVATVDENGNITLTGFGTTVISADSEANEEYKAGHAEYTLTVLDPDFKGYTLVTDIEQLTDGSSVIFVSKSAAGNQYFAMGAQNGAYRNPIDVTVENNTILPSGDVTVMTINNTGEGMYSFYIENEGFLSSTGAKSLKTSDNVSSASVSIATTGVATVKYGANAVKYNPSSPRFTTYDKGQNDIYIYYIPGSVDERPEAPISFDTEKETVYLLETNKFVLPTLNNEEELPVTWSSSNSTVAIFDVEKGILAITDYGTTTISATYTATEEGAYKTTKASFDLNVICGIRSLAQFSADYGVNVEFGFPMTVTYKNGKNTYVVDEAGNAGLIYGETPYETLDIIPAGLTATATVYYGLLEAVPVDTPAAEGKGVFAPAEITLDEVSADLISHRVVIKNVNFTETPAAKKDVTVDGVKFYNSFSIDQVEAGLYDVDAIITTFNGVQVYPIAYTPVVEEVEKKDLTLVIEGETYVEEYAENIEFTVALPEDANLKLLEWTSKDENVEIITVNGVGLADTYEPGEYTLTVTYPGDDTYNEATASVTLRVYPDTSDIFKFDIEGETIANNCSLLKIKGGEIFFYLPKEPGDINVHYYVQPTGAANTYANIPATHTLYDHAAGIKLSAGSGSVSLIAEKNGVEAPETVLAYEELTTGIAGIAADMSEGVIYDLNGRQVKGQPAAGIYVVRQGNKTYKVVVK